MRAKKTSVLKKLTHKFQILKAPEAAALNNTPSSSLWPILLQAANAATDTQTLTTYNNIVLSSGKEVSSIWAMLVKG